MVSLLALAEITEEGVLFRNPGDGTPMLLTPEHSIAIQNRLGAQNCFLLGSCLHRTPPDDCSNTKP